MKKLTGFTLVLLACCGPSTDSPQPLEHSQFTYACASNQKFSSPDFYESFGTQGPVQRFETSQNQVSYTYWVGCPKFLGCETLRYEVAQALKQWSRIPGLTFREVNNPEQAGLRISFESGEMHGNFYSQNCAIDGGFGSRSTITAHAFVKGCEAGSIHLNGELGWSFNGTSKDKRGRILLDVRSVVIHEMGHLLGVKHDPNDKASAMFPIYNGSKRRLGTSELYTACKELKLNCENIY